MRHSLIVIGSIAILGLAGAAQAQGKSGGKGHVGGGASMHGTHGAASAKVSGRTNHGLTTSAAARAKVRADKERNARAVANTRVRGSADVLANNTHASARGVERGSMSTQHATAEHGARGKAKVRGAKPRRD